MTTVQIPGSMLISFDPADLPPGPPGPDGPPGSGGVVRHIDGSRHGAKSTQALNFAPSGVKHSVTVAGPCRVRVEVSGVAGHNMAASFVHCGLSKNGVTLANGAVLGSARINSDTEFSTLAIDYLDVVEAAGVYEYEVLIKQTQASGTAYGYLGRRGYNLDPTVATTITLSVLDPLP